MFCAPGSSNWPVYNLKCKPSLARIIGLRSYRPGKDLGTTDTYVCERACKLMLTNDRDISLSVGTGPPTVSVRSWGFRSFRMCIPDVCNTIINYNTIIYYINNYIGKDCNENNTCKHSNWRKYIFFKLVISTW